MVVKFFFMFSNMLLTHFSSFVSFFHTGNPDWSHNLVSFWMVRIWLLEYIAWLGRPFLRCVDWWHWSLAELNKMVFGWLGMWHGRDIFGPLPETINSHYIELWRHILLGLRLTGGGSCTQCWRLSFTSLWVAKRHMGYSAPIARRSADNGGEMMQRYFPRRPKM